MTPSTTQLLPWLPTRLHDRRCRPRVSESSLNAYAGGLSVALQDNVSPAPFCNRSHHRFDHVVTDCLACRNCKHCAMIHRAEVRRSLLPSFTIVEEPAVERYDVVPFRRLRQCGSSSSRDATQAEHLARNGMWVADCNSLSNPLGSAAAFFTRASRPSLLISMSAAFMGFGHVSDRQKALRRFNHLRQCQAYG